MCNFYVWENANINDLNAWRILMKFLCIYLGEGMGDALVHVYIWEHTYSAFTTEPIDGCLWNLVGM